MPDTPDATNFLKEQLRIDTPRVYAKFLSTHVPRVREDGLVLYGTDDLVERNTTFEVRRYTPEFLAVGDDSGGRLVVIRVDDAGATPFIIDAGALVPDRPAGVLKALGTT